MDSECGKVWIKEIITGNSEKAGRLTQVYLHALQNTVDVTGREKEKDRSLKVVD